MNEKGKICTTCKEWKEWSIFRKNKSKKDGFSSQCKNCEKEYKQSNRIRFSEYNREWREANKEHRAIYMREWREDNKEHTAEYYKQWSEANKEYIVNFMRKWREDNKEYIAEYRRQWREENYDKCKSNDSKRRILKESTSASDAWEIAEINRFYSSCPKGHHVDHIMPLSKGGSHTLDNLQHLKDYLNLSKHAKHPDDWDDPRPISCRA